ncbi:alpha/beta fold hydrolase [Sphingomonas populi]|uniref:Alpha/beta fold hydrolase n=1 Tax=Sphingomonas populi TaxID=2484750 RepID=A0A4Q6XSJ8_9SPHN|nr:alpha/beta fold hydrolase [Sphingomonas populi]RZF63453.1 alpha/beta fold hydrolase [Sphingomonas populi]
MATIVLLHGGGAGGWMWRYVAPVLTAAGHSVFTPTFTGVGDRHHLISRDITHWTHVLDVANLLEFNELEDVVLVGYSYGGSVIPGVVSLQPGRVSKALYLDAIIMHAGERLSEAMGYMDTETASQVERTLASGEGPLGAGTLEIVRAEAKAHPHKMSPERQAWMLAKITDIPLRSMVDPVRVGADSLTIPVEYLAVPEGSPVVNMHQRARELGWNISAAPDGCDHTFPFGQPEIAFDFIMKHI